MKILVTGGAGFIGSNLTNELTKKHKVTVYDNFSTGKVENLNFSENLTVIKGDITDFSFMNEVLKYEFDVIYHLAAIASVAASVKNPIQCNEVNFQATLNLLEQVRHNQFKTKIVFASSAAVYGDNEDLPLKESDAVRPLSPYAIDKYASEQYIINYAKLYGLDTCVARFFNVYGPKQDAKSPYSGVISILMDAIISSDKEFTIFGDGTQTRDFIFIEDLVKALVILATSEKSKSKVFNVGTGINIDLKEVISALELVAESSLKITYSDTRDGEVRNSKADIEELKNLGFNPDFTIDEGLKKLLTYESELSV